MRSNKKGSILILMGLLMITAALFLIIYNLREGTEAGRSSEEIVELLEEKIASVTEEENSTEPEESTESEVLEKVPEFMYNPEMEMPVVRINGNDYLGILEIPALGLKLPVMSGWSYPLLRSAPCRYTGSAYARNLILMAHNYNSHFGQIKNLHEGDKVTFTDADGYIFYYKVVEREILMPESVADMQSGGWDLTLFTCTIGGQSRVTVRCELESSA